MSTIRYVCDQAVFTSIRTPTGEGYRIIAASLGVRSEEKQTITRYSPSHEGLCAPQAHATASLDGVQGAACYPLPSGRFCVALSCEAGAEHTGRGGQRVYTHNVIIGADDWPRLGYSPFNVLRAMAAAGLTTPQLKQPAVLPGAELSVDARVDRVCGATLHPVLNSTCRRYVLQRLLERTRIIINLDGGWLETAEALILGIPGPLRAQLSFGAGLRFSASRGHHLDVFSDEAGRAKARVAGQPVEFIEPQTSIEADAPGSPWLTFVDRYWSRQDMVGLAQRTSRAFSDTGPGGRNRVAQLYNCIDEIAKQETGKLLTMTSVYLSQVLPNPERELVAELLGNAQRTLQERWGATRWTEVRRDWPTLVALRNTSEKAAAFVRPIVESAVRAAMAEHPMRAAEAALDIAETSRPGAARADCSTLIEEVLQRLAEWADQAPSGNPEWQTLPALCVRWSAARPDSAVLGRLRRRCEAMTSSTAPAPGTSI